MQDIGDNSALLIYLSADGAAKRDAPNQQGYTGGIATAANFARKAVSDGATAAAAPAVSGSAGSVDAAPMPADPPAHLSLAHCLHPQDLVPFTRKALFLIVDSTNSGAFKVCIVCA